MGRSAHRQLKPSPYSVHGYVVANAHDVLHPAVDDQTGMMVVRITDNVTGEVVKQLPPQEILDADVNMEKIVGLLVDSLA